MKVLSFLLLAILAVIVGCSDFQLGEREASTRFYKNHLQGISQVALAHLSELAPDSMTIPRSAHKDGSLHGTNSRSWTSGFYPGELWLLYSVSQDLRFKEAAMEWTQFIEKEKFDTHTHDLGFKVYNSFGHAYKNTQEKAFKDVILQASKTLVRRYNPTVGCIRSWDFNKETWEFPVIIDNMMNLEMLFEATRLSGDSIYYEIAYQHALTTLQNHVRPDHSTFHVIDYDTLTGQIRNRHTHQGQSHESSWSRGQAWGLYGFAMAYRETGDKRFHQKAIDIANFMYDHPNMPSHGVPYWDFNAEKIPHEPVDASAASIAACGMLILCELDPGCHHHMLPRVDLTLKTLTGKEFIAQTPPFLLDHSVGSIPGDSEVDVPIIYADYYFVEALIRRVNLGKKIEPSLALF
ncbi:MAG: glycoside hydrolase family 88 protein [Bacteroidota bacterium]